MRQSLLTEFNKINVTIHRRAKKRMIVYRKGCVIFLTGAEIIKIFVYIPSEEKKRQQGC